jgi:hypothetical protein
VITQAGEAGDEGGECLAARGVPVDDVVVAGGTILAQPALYEAFTTALAATAPTAQAHPLQVPPVEGAVTLARSLL